MKSFNERKSIPLGVEDFKEIREKNWLYIDKTALISDIIRTASAKVKLITRPRRFGKTLNLSMLKYFFDIEGAESNRTLFNGLEIENTPYMEHFGAYPVISVTLKGMNSRNMEQLMEKLRDRLKKLFQDYQFLLNSQNLTDIDMYDYKDVVAGKKENLTDTIQYLTYLLCKHYGKKVIILMDEYDSPIIDSYISGYYDEAITLFRSLMSNAFKTNDYLEMGIITGVSRVTRESIFSDMNNVIVYSVLSDTFSERFGFTSEEVSEILNAYGYSDKKEEVRRYYDGYRFGDEGASKTDIYNPLSILKYADSGKLNPYWVNTASDDLIKNVAVKDLQRFLEVSEELLQGGSILAAIDEGITLLELNSIDSLWTLLLYSGYVTVASHKMENHYFLRLPNEEVASYFRKLIREIYSVKVRTPENLAELLFFNREEFYEKLNLRLLHFSYFDLTSEKDYHLFLTCALLMNLDVGKGKTYEVFSNRESAKGRPDIIIRNMAEGKSIIIELKYLKAEEASKKLNIQEALREAKTQGETKLYGSDLSGDVELIPIVGCGKAFHFA